MDRACFDGWKAKSWTNIDWCPWMSTECLALWRACHVFLWFWLLSQCTQGWVVYFKVYMVLEYEIVWLGSPEVCRGPSSCAPTWQTPWLKILKLGIIQNYRKLASGVWACSLLTSSFSPWRTIFSSENDASNGLITFCQGPSLKSSSVPHHHPTDSRILVPKFLGYTLNSNKKNNTMC